MVATAWFIILLWADGQRDAMFAKSREDCIESGTQLIRSGLIDGFACVENRREAPKSRPPAKKEARP